MKEKEQELSKDEKKEIIEVAGKYGEYLSENAPQVDRSGFNYYFAGSLAAMLYASAKEIQYINIDEDKKISDGETIEISEETRKSLIDFGRKIGDIDIVQVGDKGLIQKLEHPVREPGMSLTIDTNWPYISNEKYIKRQIPDIDKLHSEKQVQNILGEDAIYGELNGAVTRDRVCRLTTTSGKVIYIASPETIIAHKVNKAINNFGREHEEEKDARDLAIFTNSILKSYEDKVLENRIIDAWTEMRSPININEENEKKAKILVAKMYKNEIEPVIKNKEDKEKLKLIGKAAFKYIDHRIEQIKTIKDIACSATLGDVNRLQKEIRNGIKDRETPKDKDNHISSDIGTGNR